MTLPKPEPLDLAEILESLSAERAELARIDAAIAAAEAERHTIGQKRADIRNAGRDGSKVADALLADPEGANGMAALLAPDVEALDREFDAYGAAIRDLKERATTVAARTANLEAEAFGVLALSVSPLVEALDRSAREMVERLVQTYADLQALRVATRAGAGQADRLGLAVRGMIGTPDPLIRYRRLTPVSDEMASALRDIAAKVPGLTIPIAPNVSLD